MTTVAQYTRTGPIGTITIDDGKVNALSIPALREVHAALDEAERDGVVVVITGREGLLSAGFDLGTFRDAPDRVPEMLLLGARLAERVLAFPRPVLVACTGHAIAAGVFLPLAADLRIGVDGPYRIGLNEVRIGLVLPWFAVELARARLQPAHFDRAVVNATIYSPRDAVAAGFLDRVVAAADLAAEVAAAAHDLTELDPEAHRATKQRARGATLGTIRAAIESDFGTA